MICVIAKIDEESKEKLISTQQAAEPFDISIKPLYGHITIATYTGCEENLFVESCKKILCNESIFRVFYESIEVLSETSIVAATLRIDDRLKELHQQIRLRWEESLDIWTKDDRWTPHTTLLYHPHADLASIAGSMIERFQPFHAFVEAIEFSKVEPGEYSIVGCVKLKR